MVIGLIVTILQEFLKNFVIFKSLKGEKVVFILLWLFGFHLGKNIIVGIHVKEEIGVDVLL